METLARKDDDYEIVEPVMFLAPDEDGFIEIRFSGQSAWLDQDTAIFLRDWLTEIYPDE